MGPRKHARGPETALRIRDHRIPPFLGDPMAPRTYQNIFNLPIYMATGTVALCQTQTNPDSWAQTPMPPHPVEAHFHIELLEPLVETRHDHLEGCQIVSVEIPKNIAGVVLCGQEE